MTETARERFEDKYMPEPNSGCWLWTATILQNGYGQFWNGHRVCPAHRFSYELHKGPVPKGLQIDHLCRVRSCVNPDHLEAVTCRENVLRGIGTTAQNARKTHCVHGHELTTENIIILNQKRGKARWCKKCNQRNNQAGHQRRMAKKRANADKETGG